MTLRGRLVAVAVAIAVLLTLAIVTLVRSRTPGCTIAAPRPALPAVLRALGDFDQAYDASDTGSLEDAAARAAAALDPDLIGATAEAPVAVAASTPGSPDALVVPLRAHISGTGAAPLAGLVVFLRDCQGNAYYDTVEDDATLQPPLLAFPPVSSEAAAAQLGAPAHLVYTATPLRPRWISDSTPARSIAAR